MASGREKSPFSQNPISTICKISTVWRGGRATLRLRLPDGFESRRHRPRTAKEK